LSRCSVAFLQEGLFVSSSFLCRFAAAAVFSLASLTSPPSLPAAAADAPAITVGASTFDSSTPVVYAVHAGLFQKAGLNVKLVPMSPAAIPPALAGGAIQFASSNLFNVVEAHTRGVPFTIVSPGALFDDTDLDGYVGLIVRKDSGITKARDFTGKTIGVPALKDMNSISSMAWIDQNGGDSNTVKYVEVPAPAAAQAVAQKRIDGTVLTSPLLQGALATGDFRVLTDSYGAIAKSFVALGWITTTDFAATHPDAVAKFVRVMHEASVYCNTHQAETVPMMAEFAKLNPDTLRTMKRAKFATTFRPEMIQPVIDMAARYKAIAAPFNAQELVSPYALKPSDR
jgi:NitT/TauT family transport system substrate-binding protein